MYSPYGSSSQYPSSVHQTPLYQSFPLTSGATPSALPYYQSSMSPITFTQTDPSKSSVDQLQQMIQLQQLQLQQFQLQQLQQQALQRSEPNFLELQKEHLENVITKPGFLEQYRNRLTTDPQFRQWVAQYYDGLKKKDPVLYQKLIDQIQEFRSQTKSFSDSNSPASTLPVQNLPQLQSSSQIPSQYSTQTPITRASLFQPQSTPKIQSQSLPQSQLQRLSQPSTPQANFSISTEQQELTPQVLKRKALQREQKRQQPTLSNEDLRLQKQKFNLIYQEQFKQQPYFHEVERSGPDHAPLFVCMIICPSNPEICGVGRARNKGNAESYAAIDALSQFPEDTAATENEPRELLHQYSLKTFGALPSYDTNFIGGSQHAPIFRSTLRIQGQEYTAQGKSKKLAEREVARIALSRIAGW